MAFTFTSDIHETDKPDTHTSPALESPFPGKRMLWHGDAEAHSSSLLSKFHENYHPFTYHYKMHLWGLLW